MLNEPDETMDPIGKGPQGRDWNAAAKAAGYGDPRVTPMQAAENLILLEARRSLSVADKAADDGDALNQARAAAEVTAFEIAARIVRQQARRAAREASGGEQRG